MSKLICEIKMECKVKGHNKMWSGELYDNGMVITTWGPINGWKTSKAFKKGKAGEAFLIQKMMEKEKKGYEVIFSKNYENI